MRLPRAAVFTTRHSSRSNARSWPLLQPSQSRHMHHLLSNTSMMPSTSIGHRIQFHEMLSLRYSAHQSQIVATSNHLSLVQLPTWLAPSAAGCLIDLLEFQKSDGLHSSRSSFNSPLNPNQQLLLTLETSVTGRLLRAGQLRFHRS